jgi:general secretion pathway protein M
MKAWLQRQSARDRRVLAGGAGLVAALLLWAFAWYPLAASRDALAAAAAQAEADLAWMRGVAPELSQRRASGAMTGLDRAGRSLLALADGTARDAGLGGALVRIEPAGAGRVNLWFERVPFDALASWLESLSRQYGVSVDELQVERAVDTGTVDARVGVVDAAAG